jgi:prepilin-type processing-associated H-X9-DG protein
MIYRTTLRRSRTAAAFTLVELLVVIGIIAVLIGILLPTLSSAQRSGKSVKCLSALRQIGTAFQQYAHEYKGYWPVAVHVYSPAGPDGVTERRWQDQVAKYLHKQPADKGADDISQYRRNSVLWGCPEYTLTEDFNASNFAHRVRNGYAMQYYPEAPSVAGSSNPARPGNLAYIDPTIPSYGQYMKQVKWTRPAERGLIADSQTHILQAPAWASITNWQPFQLSGGTVFYVDSTRHLRPSTKKEATLGSKGINMLFCDGHAKPVNVKEAWNATRGGGINSIR